MADVDDENDSMTSGRMWARAGIAGALGFEFVGLVLAGAFMGATLDNRLDSSPWALIGCIALSMVAAGWHAYLVSRRYLLDGQGE